MKRIRERCNVITEDLKGILDIDVEIEAILRKEITQEIDSEVLKSLGIRRATKRCYE